VVIDPKNEVRESAQEVLDFVHFSGYELSRDQLVRLHQKRLIGPVETRYPGGRRGLETTYPLGTAQRVLRIVQLKVTTKKFDEIAWRLWWEGYDIDFTLIRTFLLKGAARWDVRRGMLRRAADVFDGIEGTEGERDLLDELFHKKKTNFPLGTMRRRFRKNEEQYVESARLFVDLMAGRLDDFGPREVSLFEAATGYNFESDIDEDGVDQAGAGAFGMIMECLNSTSTEVAESLDEAELRFTRQFAHFLLQSMSNIGKMMSATYGGTGKGFGLAGTSFEKLSRDPDEQVLAILLLAVFLRNPEIRDNLPEFEERMAQFNGVTFQDYLRLRYLAEAVPGLGKLVTPERMKLAIESEDGMRRHEARIANYRADHADEIDRAIRSRPDLFPKQLPTAEAVT